MKKKYVSPIGTLIITAEGDAVTEIRYTDEADISAAEGNDVLELCVRELDAYFTGKLREFTVKIKPAGTAFRMRCWEELKKIPYGETISYKELASRIGNPAAVRAVGGANHHNPLNIIIPCHRVIGADGSLTGYGGGLEKKKFLLKLEREAESPKK